MRVAEAVAEALVNDQDIDFEDPLANEVMRSEQLEVGAACNSSLK